MDEAKPMAKTIVLGVSGGIAAVKLPELTRLLVKKDFSVHCILTEHALNFITPASLAALTGNPVLSGHFETAESGEMKHIELAEKADLILVAPATANILAKMAQGIADDLLSTTLLAAQSPIAVCPAMNVVMWENKATQDNLKILKRRGIFIIGPAEGMLACGYEGFGRMEEPESIVEEVDRLLAERDRLDGKEILITAGPTREFFDPVRFLSNPSSGKMGYALAQAAIRLGAQVTLISGPSEEIPPFGSRFVPVVTAEEMEKAVQAEFPSCDIFISAAAVSDWKPKKYTVEKEKKSAGNTMIELERTPDILASVSKRRKNGQVLVGFAAETENLETNALKKLKEKNLDLIVGNLISTNGYSAFGSEQNEITIIGKSGEIEKFPRMSKTEAAFILLNQISEKCYQQGNFSKTQ